jgi:peroxiredoxin
VTRKQLVGVAGVTLAVALVGTRFFAAAAETAARGRANACRSLAPSALPPLLASGDPPDFELPDATGKTWSLRALRGRPVLLNFWATWCAPCIEEMPSMEELARRVGDDAVILAVSVDTEWDKVKRFFGGRGTRMSVLLDAPGEVPKKYGTTKYPESFLIDSGGKIRHYIVNTRNWNQAEAALCLESLR